ncbi:hypothetical protein AUJ69_02770 [Candidatus Woesearchaeota archaeon CG1_02_47_18]|nr:MAG: hypothetical protein AUJ69_02770 [Candidatus Woesearchaeota archaeon CG1_02_47_18]
MKTLLLVDRRENVGITAADLTLCSDETADETDSSGIASLLSYIDVKDGDRMSDQLAEWLHTVSSTPLSSGKCLKELASFSNVSMFWFVRNLFYEDIRYIMRLYMAASNAIKRLRPDFISICGSDLFCKAAALSAEKQGVKHRVIVIPGERRHIDVKSKARIAGLMSKRLLRSLGIPRKNSRKPRIAVLARSRDLVHGIMEDASRGFFDSQLGPVISRLAPEARLYIIDLAGSERLMRLSLKRKGFIPWESVIARALLDPKVIASYTHALDCFRKRWRQLESDQEFINLFRFKGLQLWPVIKRRLQHCFCARLGSFAGSALNIEIARSFLRRERIDCVIAISENAAWSNFIFASRLEGTPCIGVQHGAIFSRNISYMFHKDETTLGYDETRCPLADKTAVYGPYYKKLLVNEGHYPKGSILVSGQVRTDLIAHRKQLYSREGFIRREGLPENARIILYASIPDAIITREQRSLGAEAILSAVSRLRNVFLIVKMHPAEADATLYRELASRFRVNNLKMVPASSDLYEQLDASELLVTTNSTVSLEAVLFSKPVVLLNMVCDFDSMDLARNGLAAVVTRVDKTYDVIKAYLDGSVSIDPKKRERFIRKYYHQIDGRASERIACAALRLARQHGRKHLEYSKVRG